MYNGGPIQAPRPAKNLCNYCHQQPKRPPHDYCSKACGARDKASANAHSRNPVICKQCGQRQVHKGHEFCGKTCANAWQAVNGQINTGWNGPGQPQPQWGQQQSWGAMPPPPQMPFPPNNRAQSFQGPSQGGGIKGMVKGLKGLVSQNQQPQQFQPSQPPPLPGSFNPGPPHTQQFPGYLPPGPSMVSPPISPMSSGMSDPMTPASPAPSTSGFSQQYYTGQSSPSSPSMPDPTPGGHSNGQYFSQPPSQNQSSAPGPSSGTRNVGVNPPTYSSSVGGAKSRYDPDDLYANPNHDPMASSDDDDGGPVSLQAVSQTQFSIQVNSSSSGAGKHGNGNWDPNGPGFPTTCRLNGCNKSVYVDSVSNNPSEYCSQRHREDAMASGQVNPCIMCKKKPRTQNDHFCSRACRDKALSP